MYNVITGSETHLQAGIPSNLFNLEVYHESIKRDMGHMRIAGGGVAKFIKNLKQFHVKEYTLEALCVQFNTIEGNILICCYLRQD